LNSYVVARHFRSGIVGRLRGIIGRLGGFVGSRRGFDRSVIDRERRSGFVGGGRGTGVAGRAGDDRNVVGRGGVVGDLGSRGRSAIGWSCRGRGWGRSRVAGPCNTRIEQAGFKDLVVLESMS